MIIISLIMLYNIPYVYKFTNLILLVYRLDKVPGIDVFQFPIQEGFSQQVYLCFFQAKGIMYFLLLLNMKAFRMAIFDWVRCRKASQTQEAQKNMALDAFLFS